MVISDDEDEDPGSISDVIVVSSSVKRTRSRTKEQSTPWETPRVTRSSAGKKSPPSLSEEDSGGEFPSLQELLKSTKRRKIVGKKLQTARESEVGSPPARSRKTRDTAETISESEGSPPSARNRKTRAMAPSAGSSLGAESDSDDIITPGKRRFYSRRLEDIEVLDDAEDLQDTGMCYWCSSAFISPELRIL